MSERSGGGGTRDSASTPFRDALETAFLEVLRARHPKYVWTLVSAPPENYTVGGRRSLAGLRGTTDGGASDDGGQDVAPLADG